MNRIYVAQHKIEFMQITTYLTRNYFQHAKWPVYFGEIRNLTIANTALVKKLYAIEWYRGTDLIP